MEYFQSTPSQQQGGGATAASNQRQQHQYHYNGLNSQQNYGANQSQSNSHLYYQPTQMNSQAQKQQQQPQQSHFYPLQPASATAPLDHGAQQQQHHTSTAYHHTPTSHAASHHQQHQQELPLRILVDSRYIGAIIGQGGAQIREINKESRARAVVETQKNHKSGHGDEEKLIVISGNSECCSKAVVKILEIIQREQNKDDTEQVELKICAHNQLVGRLIGKHGTTIKQIMKDTETTISVSNSSSDATRTNGTFPPFDIAPSERTIYVRGPTIETVSCAESKITAKLRKCYESDARFKIQALQKDLQSNMANPAVIQQMAATIHHPFANLMSRFAVDTANRTVRMWVPDNMVGAIIGTKGKNIKNLIRDTSAQIKIDSSPDRKKSDESSGSSERHDLLEDQVSETPATTTESDESQDSNGEKPEEEKKVEERMITISGNHIQVTRAQISIYSRLAEQMNQPIDEFKLRTEISVPSKLIGRIIGKGGQNVRELQRITGATVKIPEDERHSSGDSSMFKDKEEEDMTVVRIIGAMHPSQNVQYRLQQLVVDYIANEKKTKESSSANTSGGSTIPADTAYPHQTPAVQQPSPK
ncbi:unnamed protein product [Caenorhabditis bovis]|uniref:K Homology domain-containing protein n=1 Tax=Caenorhabditis bovis TaxID=2654633 RepID=A0A8S1ESB5_9PELO|nr:unnamed protein product [Caenorhabditis bovis]